MNKYEKLVQKQFLDDEERIIKRLKTVYGQSLKDINGKVAELDSSIAALQKAYNSVGDDEIGELAATFLKSKQIMTPEEAKATLQSMIQSKVYQKKYQEALKKQVGGVLDIMQVKEYKAISEYLTECYENGFIGTMYDLQGQGIPLCFPMDQEAMVRAVQLDSKISKGLYQKLGEDVDLLKRKITAQVSRGIASGLTFQQVAQGLAGVTNIGFNKAVRIARTEGHRIQCQAGMDACYKAKEKGADVVKQWDAALDSRTRESHTVVDGEIRELDKPFSNGLMFPGDPSGGAAEVINCRCALLQRARWALDEDELEALKKKAEYYGLDKTANFEEYKQKYLKAAAQEPEVKPKKEYLTEKKLQSNIAEIEEKQKLLPDGSDEWQQLEDLKIEYQDKLNKKLVAKETKKLKKEEIKLQADLDDFEIKTYSNIWKDDVTTADWSAKQGSIAAKKQYFESKLKSDPSNAAKWQGLIDDLDDFDKNGAEYYKIQSSLNKVKGDLTKLQNNGIMGAQKADADYSQARKDAALWFDRDHGGFRAADKYFDAPAQAIYSGASPQEFDGFYTYTAGSGGHNRPLAGFEKPWSRPGSGWEEEFYKGSKNVWIDFEGKGDQIRGLTTLIQRSTYPDDVWLQSGQNFATLEGLLGIPYGSLSSMSDAALQQFVGTETVIQQFISTAVNEGGGACFNSRPMKFNIFAPKGSQMLYASDKGVFGKGENEMILQRGGTYRITKIYWGNDATDGNTRKLFVDMEIHPEKGYDLFQQDPNEWKGSKKNYRS